MSFISKWISKIQSVMFPEVAKTFEQHQVELAAVEAKVEVADVKVETIVKPAVKKVATKVKTVKKEGEVKKATKAKKPNIKIAK